MTMKLKRILTAALAAAVLTGSALAADDAIAIPLEDGAVTPAAADQSVYEINRRTDNDAIRVWGTVQELGEQSVYIENSSDGAPYQKIVVKISEDTAIVDAVTGAAKTFADLKEGETLYAYVSPAMTRSMPPQSVAELVICNIPADLGVPTYAQVEHVTEQEDGKIDLLVSGAMILHLDAETELLSYGSETAPTLADIKPGAMVLSWYQIVAMSYPGQAGPSRVVLFPYEYAGYLSAGEGSLSVNGKALDLDESVRPFAQDGKLMVPVRKLAEALGCTVTWDAQDPAAVAVTKDGESLYSLTIGGDTMVLEGDMAMSVSAPVTARNGVTFACVDDLLVAHNAKLESQSVFG
ncbi:conserved exported hypothetical protein [uncultured Eubacteriales bacterium]|uniref:Copper amine oxidase-like N-terminal domain-containing protein n=1 Tax=uncultured Eubacteriales bacterium TaxID=172733 RepID=A0A212J7H4_9FIRM|nr:conserved exported hypothetical protein [uncultured Eubacteriales bacterium]